MLSQDLIDKYKLTGSVEDYCLVYQKSDKIREYKIVTEHEKSEMNAKIIELQDSPAVSSSTIIKIIEDWSVDNKDLQTTLEDLKDKAVDPSFAAEFLSRSGLETLITGVVTKFRSNELGLVLHAVSSLLDHQVYAEAGSIQEPSQEFIVKLAELTSKESNWNTAIRCALHILALYVKEDKNKDMIDQKITFPNLIALLGNNDLDIQLTSLGLINSLLNKVDQERKRNMIRSLQEREARSLILDSLVSKSKETQTQLVCHQLYLLQYHMFSLLNTRLNTPIQPQDNVALQKIKDLRSTAFDTGSPGVKNNTKYTQDYTKLGFKDTKDPSRDFLETPPGMLALECMDYFAKQHQEKFMKVVLENSCRQDNHECPFAISSCELVTLLTDILGVGKPPVPHQIRFHEMFFKAEHPFEEFFSHSIVIFNKTWRDMRATRHDFNKVLNVVREQLETSLNPENRHERPKTFDQFRGNVKTYSEISKKWQAEAKNREAWENSAPVTELKEHLVPEIEELIRQQRANFMVEGTRFNRIKKTGEQVKNQFRYVKLSINHKTIYVGDWNSDKSSPTIEDLEPKLHLENVADIRTGAGCDFLREYKKDFKDQYSKLAFSLVDINGDSLLDLVAPDELTQNYWVDGLNNLKNKQMQSEDFIKERQILLNMEIKLRLLDLEGIDLPQQAPPIPPPPADFNFASC